MIGVMQSLYLDGVRSTAAVMALDALQSGPLPISKLAARTPVSRAAMTGTVDRLEKRGLVQRRPNEFDRRGVVVALTQKGESLLNG